MQKTGIEWADYSWNPVSGCRHGCEYCYARKIAARWGKTPEQKAFEPAYHEGKSMELKPHTKGVVFIGSNCDLWGSWVPDEWIQHTIWRGNANEHAALMYLTKNPARYAEFVKDFDPKGRAWLGTTLDDGYESTAPLVYDGYESTAPLVYDRITAIGRLDYPRKWVSIEPLHFDYSHAYYDDLLDRLQSIGWVVIGTETRSGKPVPKGHEPDVTDVWEIIEGARMLKKIPVFVKDSIHQLWPDEDWPREFPTGVALATKQAAWKPKVKGP